MFISVQFPCKVDGTLVFSLSCTPDKNYALQQGPPTSLAHTMSCCRLGPFTSKGLISFTFGHRFKYKYSLFF